MNKPPDYTPHYRITIGIELLKQARDCFSIAGAPRTAVAVRKALASAEGARRHIERKNKAESNVQ
jgi:hypothetical protein